MRLNIFNTNRIDETSKGDRVQVITRHGTPRKASGRVLNVLMNDKGLREYIIAYSSSDIKRIRENHIKKLKKLG